MFGISIVKTLYYNFFSPHFVRKNRGFAVIYKKCHFSFKKGGKIIIDGGKVFFGGKSPFHSFFRLEEGSSIIVFENCHFGYGSDFLLSKNSTLLIEKNVYINCNFFLRCASKITIKENCLIAHQVTMRDSDGHFVYEDKKKGEIIVNQGVWICAQVTILKNVKIGKGSVIGARSLVIKDVPEKTLVAGVPATVIKTNVAWKR